MLVIDIFVNATFIAILNFRLTVIQNVLYMCCDNLISFILCIYSISNIERSVFVGGASMTSKRCFGVVM